MTNEELNRAVTELVMGECWHEPNVNREWHGETDIVVVRCGKCGADLGYPEQISYRENYLTGDGMLRVIEKMRERGMTHYCIEHAGSMGHRVMFTNYNFSINGDMCDEFLPRAVALAAVEFCKKEKGNDQ